MPSSFPLPHTCSHHAYTPGDEDEWGNATPTWADPVTVSCIYWPGGTHEPTQSEQVSVDLTLVIDSKITVDHRDTFTIDREPYEVIGRPIDYDHGPYSFKPGRKVVELRWVG